jgi:hypothetical protein
MFHKNMWSQAEKPLNQHFHCHQPLRRSAQIHYTITMPHIKIRRPTLSRLIARYLKALRASQSNTLTRQEALPHMRRRPKIEKSPAAQSKPNATSAIQSIFLREITLD